MVPITHQSLPSWFTTLSNFHKTRITVLLSNFWIWYYHWFSCNLFSMRNMFIFVNISTLFRLDLMLLGSCFFVDTHKWTRWWNGWTVRVIHKRFVEESVSSHCVVNRAKKTFRTLPFWRQTNISPSGLKKKPFVTL